MGTDVFFSRDACLLDLLTQEMLHLAQPAAFRGRDKGDGNTSLTGTSGAADAVDVDLRVIRQGVVEHMRDVVNIESAGSYVSCHNHFDLVLAETVERAFARILA